MMKRIVALILCLVLCLSVTVASAAGVAVNLADGYQITLPSGFRLTSSGSSVKYTSYKYASPIYVTISQKGSRMSSPISYIRDYCGFASLIKSSGSVEVAYGYTDSNDTIRYIGAFNTDNYAYTVTMSTDIEIAGTLDSIFRSAVKTVLRNSVPMTSFCVSLTDSTEDLSGSVLPMQLYETEYLYVHSIVPADANETAVYYTSSDPSVVSVAQDGTLYAAASGTAIITATGEGGSYEESFTVHVAGSIVLDPAETTLIISDETPNPETVLSVKSLDGRSYTYSWKSGNTHVATVSWNGRVTAIASGICEITVTANEDPSATATCTLYVKDSGPVEAFVKRAYSLILGRTADPSGLKSWTDALLSGSSSGGGIIWGFVNSQEFISAAKPTDEQVEIMYNVMLGRGSDPVGKAAWTGYLNDGMSINAIAAGFVGSQEFIGICENYGIDNGTVAKEENRDQNASVTSFVARCFREALGRNADIAGLNAWTGVILDKSATPQQVAQGFVFSPEVVMKSLSNGDFVDMLYKLYMGHVADPSGKAAWTLALDTGATREKVTDGFANSVEFKAIVASYGLDDNPAYAVEAEAIPEAEARSGAETLTAELAEEPATATVAEVTGNPEEELPVEEIVEELPVEEIIEEVSEEELPVEELPVEEEEEPSFRPGLVKVRAGSVVYAGGAEVGKLTGALVAYATEELANGRIAIRYNRDGAAVAGEVRADAISEIGNPDAYKANGENRISIGEWYLEPAVFEMTEEPAVEEIPAEEPVAEEIPAEEPVAEEPAVEEIPAEEPAAEEVPAEEPVAEEPAVEEIPAEEPAVEETPAEEPAVEEIPEEEPAAEEVPAEEPVAEEPAVEEIPAEEPAAEEAPAEDPAAEEAPVEEPAVEEIPAEEPVTEEVPAEEPVAEEPAVEEIPAEEPVAEEAPAEEPVAEEIPVEEPVAEEPAVEEIPAEEPVAEEAPAEPAA